MRYTLLLFAAGCSATAANTTPSGRADVTRVEASGNAGSYSFSVTLESPDTGCDQYADWWEVLSEEGALIYRRILAHSHVDEQPFTRSGSPVDAAEDQRVFIRAHMSSDGYGGKVMAGTVAAGFSETSVAEDFAAEVEHAEPLPTDCAF